MIKSEITSGILRIWDGEAIFGDPFKISIAFVGDEKIAILKGLRTDNFWVTKETRIEIAKELWNLGFTEVMWRRYRKDGSTHEMRVQLFGLINPKNG